MWRLWALMASAATALAAEVPFLDLPLDCVLGDTCFIEDYVDADPDIGQRDYTCGLKSRDGHRGTDIALLSFDAMDLGVDVLAAAAGTVEAIRDGVADQPYSAANAEALRGRECGNAVRIGHDNGYQTLYCHLAEGSLRVTPGDRVSAAQPLGLVGLSGQTNYPHVHVSVLRDGKHIDPFRPQASGTCASEPGDTLWREAIPYTPTGLFTAGFSDKVPEFADVQSGAARVQVLEPDTPMVLYGHIFYPEEGDVIHLSVAGPAGIQFEREETIQEARSQVFRAFGKRAPDAGWPKGTFRGYVRVTRAGQILAVRHADVVVN